MEGILQWGDTFVSRLKPQFLAPDPSPSAPWELVKFSHTLWLPEYTIKNHTQLYSSFIKSNKVIYKQLFRRKWVTCNQMLGSWNILISGGKNINSFYCKGCMCKWKLGCEYEAKYLNFSHKSHFSNCMLPPRFYNQRIPCFLSGKTYKWNTKGTEVKGAGRMG